MSGRSTSRESTKLHDRRRSSVPRLHTAPTPRGPNPVAKALSLITLTVQNSALVLVLRYSRTLPPPRYLATSAVLLCELIKLAISLGMCMRTLPARRIPVEVFSEGWVYLAVPAILYTVQNNLQYLAASRLDAATFQVTYQLKILTTALCSVWLLKRKLSKRKWTALFILTCGVALVQFPTSTRTPAPDETEQSVAKAWTRRILGLTAVAAACLISGLAGVYFEKILKGSKTSLWVRNVQLSLFSLVPALFGVLVVDGVAVREHGFLYAFNKWTWAAIWCQALGGLIVSLVVKYADNILKGFATSVSIILSSVASIFLFDFHLSMVFAAGASLVMYATFLYGQPERGSGSANARLLKSPLPVFRSNSNRQNSRSISPKPLDG